jgi:phage gp46-like protein
MDPFVMVNPPYKLVSSITQKHTDFLLKLAAYQPELEIINVKSEKLGNNVVRISADILNKAALASHTKLGERSYWVKRIAVKLTTGSGQTLISGKKNQLLNTVEGYSTQKLTWLVKGTGTATIEAGSPTTGHRKVIVNL